MFDTDGRITQDFGDYQEENVLFTYDESEIEQNKIAKNNAKLVFNPKFIPFYPKFLELGLTINESLVFGFIDFYLQNSSDKFYFTNEQIGSIFGFGEQNTSNIIKKLKDKGFIDTKYRLKANGGKIRFIQKLYSDYNKNYSPTITKVIDNNNKINNNKINIINNNTEQSSEIQNQPSNEAGNQTELVSYPINELKEKEKSSAKKEKESIKEITLEINDLISKLKDICNQYGVAYDSTKDRMFAKHILTAKDYGEFCEKNNQDRVTFACNVLLASIKINYWKGALSGPMKIYQNYPDLYNQTKQKAAKTYTPTIQVL